MNTPPATVAVRDLSPDETAILGRMLVDVYANLPGFPTPGEQPDYYRMLADIGRFADRPATRVLGALGVDGTLLGGLVYFADMAQYGSAGIATTLRQVSGIRLLGVHPAARGRGVGKALTARCIRLARQAGHREVVLHTTRAMRVAWAMYESLGFTRAPDLDFVQGDLDVFGFRLPLG
jgi:GNAT superfamily N-acetyltransferase